MKSEIEKYIYPNYFAKGYPFLTPKVNNIWENILNIFIECFEKEFNEIKIVNTLPLTYDMSFVSKFYGKYFERLEDMIPVYTDENNIKKTLLTDKLPAVVNYLKNNNLDNLISTYTVVRPRSFGLRTYLYEEFIRYFQLIISSEKYEEDEFEDKIISALNEFFDKINLHVILGGRPSESYYSKKSTYFSIWLDNRITDILQCGLLRKSVVDSLYDTSNKTRLIMDIGGTQRLVTAWIYANSDKFGLKLPYHMRDYDVLLELSYNSEMSEDILRICEDKKYRVLKDESLGKQKINKIKKIGYSESVDIMLLQRKRANKEFYDVFYRDGKKLTVKSLEEVSNILDELKENANQTIIDKQKEAFTRYIDNEKIYPSAYFGKLPIMNKKLFIEN